MFFVPTADQINYECFVPAYKAFQRGKSKTYRKEAWQRLLRLVSTQGDYDPECTEQKRALKSAFFHISPSPDWLSERIEEKLLAEQNSGKSYSCMLKALYEDDDLDIIDGEGSHWMKVLSEKHDIQWPTSTAFQVNHQQKKAAPIDQKGEFCRLLRERYNDDSMSRREVWESIKDMLDPAPVGLFVSNWPFKEKEFLTAAKWRGYENRREMWDVLCDEMLITPNDPAELKAFRAVFFRISPTPKAMISWMEDELEESPWKKGDQIPNEACKRFAKDCIPGEIHWHWQIIRDKHRSSLQQD